MRDTYDLNADDHQANIREFMDVHGPEGFFTLYFRQLFYRYIKQELKSATDEIDDVGQQLYFNADGDELLTQYRTDLLAQCEARARELVADLQADPELAPVIQKGDLERFTDVEDEFLQAVHDEFDEWKREGIALLDDVDANEHREPDE